MTTLTGPCGSTTLAWDIVAYRALALAFRLSTLIAC